MAYFVTVRTWVRSLALLFRNQVGAIVSSQVRRSWFERSIERHSLLRCADDSDMDVGRFAEGQGLREVVERTRFRFPKQAEQPDLMPDPDALDTDQAVRTLLSEKAPELTGSRRKMSNQLVILQRAFAGRPEILLIHALAISYLRRDTPHTQKARRIFFKLWNEQGEWLAANLNARWLISALLNWPLFRPDTWA